MTVKHTLVSLDMRVFALCSLMELHRRKNVAGEKQVVADFGNRGGQRDRRQRRAVGKRAIADGCDGIGDGDVGQPAAE